MGRNQIIAGVVAPFNIFTILEGILEDIAIRLIQITPEQVDGQFQLVVIDATMIDRINRWPDQPVILIYHPGELSGEARDVIYLRKPLEPREVITTVRQQINLLTLSRTGEILQNRFNALFESLNISIWDEDISGVVEALGQLKKRGVVDLEQYLQNQPDLPWKFARMIRVNYVNRATVSLFRGESREDILFRIDQTFSPDSINLFIQELLAIWRGDPVFQGETTLRKLDGTIFPVEISFQIPRTLNGFKHLSIAIIDISHRKVIEERLEQRVNQLSAPDISGGEIVFEDLFDLGELQILQDQFAEATGVASLITDPEGNPITKPSNFCRFCSDIVRKNKQGCANCQHSDAKIGKLCIEGPTIQTCMSGGLWDAGAGISTGGKHLANWIIGQVRDETQKEEQIRAYAREIGVDEEELVTAFYEVPQMSQEQFESVSRVLFTLANQISKVAYQNIQQARWIVKNEAVERELRQLRNYLSNIIDSMPSILVGIDQHYRVTQWNRTAVQITGISEEDAQGRIITDLLPRINQHMGAIAEGVHQQKIGAKQHQEYLYQGERRYENITIFPLTGVGEPGAVIRLDDVTREHQLQGQLQQSRKMDAIGKLAGGVAHDFNNMLTGIMGAAQLLKSPARGVDSKGIQFVDIILKATDQAAVLVSKLLTFGRQSDLKLKPVRFHTIINDSVTLLRRSIDRGIGINTTLEAKEHYVMGDYSELQNVLINLVINGAHAMKNQGIISIQTDNLELDQDTCQIGTFDLKPGHYLHIKVRDYGSGISEKDLKRIFEPFFTTKKQGEGTGLGLSTVYGTIQRHHGGIWVESEVGKGTTFEIYLPLIS